MERFTSHPEMLFLSTMVVFSNVPLDLANISGQSNHSIHTTQSKPTKKSTSKVKPTKKSTSKVKLPKKPPKSRKTTSLQPPRADKNAEVDVRLGDKVLLNQSLFIEKLLDSGSTYALVTRPHCLGKTRFLQLLDSFFRGKRHVFEGTALFDRGNTDYKNGSWLEYPVIYLDFGRISSDALTTTVFKSKLHNVVQLVANSYGMGSDCSDLALLIERLQLKYNLPVVILVDEYDRPVMDILVHKPTSRPTGWLEQISSQVSAIFARDRNKLAARIKQELETFFRVFDSVDGRRMKLVLVAGVSRLRINGLDEKGPFVDMTKEYSSIV
jgi:hypothetical protein